MSWTVMPFEDPTMASSMPDAAPPPVEQQDLHAGLMEPHEMMAGLGYVKDQVNLEKARAERSQLRGGGGGNPSGGGGNNFQNLSKEGGKRPARRPRGGKAPAGDAGAQQ